MKEIIRKITNIHIPGEFPDVLLFSVPRSGSTWVMQLIASQKGFKLCDEPLNLRREIICRNLGICNWVELYKESSYPAVERYFKKISSGKLAIHNISPLNKYYKFFTRRIGFKVLHGCELWHKELAESLNAKSLLLVRHPVAVSLSREELPRLTAFVESEYRKILSDTQLKESRNIIESGSNFEKGILSWCFQVYPFFRQKTGVDAIISYEQTVLDPGPVIKLLMERLFLQNEKNIWSRLKQPSGSTFKSDKATKNILSQAEGDKRETYLITKWSGKVNKEQKQRAQDILNLFDIDIYQINDFLPQTNIWVGKYLEERKKLELQMQACVK